MDRIKERFQKQKKIFKISGIVITSIYVVLGILFAIVGFALGYDTDDGGTFLSLAGTFIVLGLFMLFLFALLSKRLNYEKYAKRCKKYGSVDVFKLEERVNKLEEENNELRNLIEELSDKQNSVNI